MGFDFAAAERAAEQESKAGVTPLIAAIVLGQSRAGKSYLAGTLPGKTLFLYMQGEEHGRDSARLAAGGKLVPVAFDLDPKTGKVLGADSAYKALLEIVRDTGAIVKAGFTAVAVDGLTELEALVRSTSAWALECRTKTGEHNSFAEPAATIKMIRPVLDALRALQRDHGLHYYVTCLLMVKETAEDGEILASEPKSQGYECAATLIPQFPDQIMIGRMVSPKGVEMHRLQFSAKASKVVKEKNGAIKKLIGFVPCLRGVPSNMLPDNMKADLGEVLRLKAKCQNCTATETEDEGEGEE